MNGFHTIDTTEFGDICHRLGNDWALLGTGAERPNVMTVSWGGMGVLWGKEVAFCFVRPQRHTFSLIEKGDGFSLSFLLGADLNIGDAEREKRYRDALKLCGTKSGRDMDKFAAAGLTPAFCGKIPYPAEAGLVVFCRKLYADDLKKSAFIDTAVLPHYYEADDFHRMYIGEIEQIIKRND